MRHVSRALFAALGATVGVIGFGVAASAADLLTKAPISPAAPASWTGCYIGANVGGGWHPVSAFDPTFLVNAGSANGSGVVGGGQVGCDYQFQSFVVGIAGMFDGSSIKGSGTDLEVAGLTSTSAIPWLAALTGRAGYLVLPSALIYAKGGGAWARDNITSTITAIGAVAGAANYTASGWTVGGGIEYQFAPHWSVFVEYDYLGFGTATRTITFTPIAGGGSAPFNITENLQMGVVGINFRY